jgi:hypothetical protein
MFFGDLVNPVWWNYIWLSEGFATLFEGYITDLVFPEWRFRDMVLLNTLQRNAFEADEIESVRPMTKYVETPREIAGLFDDITYPKCKNYRVLYISSNIHLFSSWKCSPDVPICFHYSNIHERFALLLVKDAVQSCRS